MVCKNCGTVVTEDMNFCTTCSAKQKEVCDCWIKKQPYNCGQDKCPGYRLFAMEQKSKPRMNDRR